MDRNVKLLSNKTTWKYIYDINIYTIYFIACFWRFLPLGIRRKTLPRLETEIQFFDDFWISFRNFHHVIWNQAVILTICDPNMLDFKFNKLKIIIWNKRLTFTLSGFEIFNVTTLIVQNWLKNILRAFCKQISWKNFIEEHTL